jgi:hypothetical protein
MVGECALWVLLCVQIAGAWDMCRRQMARVAEMAKFCQLSKPVLLGAYALGT